MNILANEPCQLTCHFDISSTAHNHHSNMDSQDLFNIKSLRLEIDEYIVEHFRDHLKIKDIITNEVAARIYKDLCQKKLKKSWSNDELSLFIWLIIQFYALKPFSLKLVPDSLWEKLQNITRRPAQFLKQQWQNLQKLTVTQYPWSKEEDEFLIEIINVKKQHNLQNKWSQISEDLYERRLNIYRSAKQCRERWINHLNPQINNRPWTEEQIAQLLEQVKLFGKKWSIISKKLQRNENQVKNKYNSLMKKKESLVYKDQLVKKVQIVQNCENINLDSNLNHDFGFINLKTNEIIICDRTQFFDLLRRQNTLQKQDVPVTSEEFQFESPFDSVSNFLQFDDQMPI